jgi:hypothetical protein
MTRRRNAPETAQPRITCSTWFALEDTVFISNYVNKLITYLSSVSFAKFSQPADLVAKAKKVANTSPAGPAPSVASAPANTSAGSYLTREALLSPQGSTYRGHHRCSAPVQPFDAGIVAGAKWSGVLTMKADEDDAYPVELSIYEVDATSGAFIAEIKRPTLKNLRTKVSVRFVIQSHFLSIDRPV